MVSERLHKVLAHAGFGSRRKCEEIISQRRVSVDGKVVTEMGVKVDPGKQRILCDGHVVRQEKRIALVVNKPKGYVCTTSDERGRPQITDLVKIVSQRVYPIGRLDADSEGMVIVSNDGELANLLTHPRYQVHKTYIVDVVGNLSRETVDQLRQGVRLVDGKTAPARVSVVSMRGGITRIKMEIREGRNRQIRRMLTKVGHSAKALKRVQIDGVEMGKLPIGKYRKLTEKEYAKLIDSATACGAQ